MISRSLASIPNIFQKSRSNVVIDVQMCGNHSQPLERFLILKFFERKEGGRKEDGGEEEMLLVGRQRGHRCL
jgi:hypothetical protein